MDTLNNTNMIGLIPNIETCKKLKEMGFPQKCEHYHNSEAGSLFFDLLDAKDKLQYLFAAPTFQEIWNQFPEIIMVKGNYSKTAHLGDDVELAHAIRIGKVDGISWIELHCGDDTIFEVHSIDCIEENLAQAAAEMWIWLKENNYIK